MCHKTFMSSFFVSGPKLYKEPSFKSNKFIIHNAISRCCLAGKVNEPQKNKIIEVSDLTVIFLGWWCYFPLVAYLKFSRLSLRKWRRAPPTTSSFSSGIRVANSGRFTPWTRRLRNWCVWLALAHGSSTSPWSSLSTNTAQTASSSWSSRLKPCPWAWTLSPSPANCGRPSGPGRPKSLEHQSEDDWVSKVSQTFSPPSSSGRSVQSRSWCGSRRVGGLKQCGSDRKH